jgi:hypothetical protein
MRSYLCGNVSVEFVDFNIVTISRSAYDREGIADLQKRCTALLEMQREQPTPTDSTPAKEWTGVMKRAIT